MFFYCNAQPAMIYYIQTRGGDKMNDNATIAQNIKALREHHNISQVEFAKMMEVTDRAISAWETGIKEPRLKNINKIAEIFNVPPRDNIRKSRNLLSKQKLPRSGRSRNEGEQPSNP
jgi:transcriptional regulator with XRE-family HTH domain